MAEPEHNGIIVGAVGVIAEVEWVGKPSLLNALLTLENDPQQVMVVFASASPNTVYCMVLTPQTKISRGMRVYDTGRPLSIPVGEAVLGRAMNVFGQQLDGRGEVLRDIMRPVISEVAPR